MFKFLVVLFPYVNVSIKISTNSLVDILLTNLTNTATSRLNLTKIYDE